MLAEEEIADASTAPVVVTFRCPPDRLVDLDNLAKREDRTRSGQLNHLIRNALDKAKRRRRPMARLPTAAVAGEIP